MADRGVPGGDIQAMNQFLEEARLGDPSATHVVVEHLRPRISKMAAYYARCCGEDPDDLLQEAWLGMLEALPNLDMRIGSPEQHLIQRARWRMLDAIKRARIRRCVPLDDQLMDTMHGPRPDDTTGGADVSEFTSSLTDTQRAVVDCLMAGHTWRETGAMLGCTSANIAYHVRQIRRRYESWNTEMSVTE